MFNALAYSKELEQAGFSRDQAEATINVFFKFMEYNFATKTDITGANYDIKSAVTQLRAELKSLSVELHSEIAQLRTEFKTELNELRIELRAELKREISELRTELKTEISDLRYQISNIENRMTIKFGLMQAATIGILAALIKFL